MSAGRLITILVLAAYSGPGASPAQRPAAAAAPATAAVDAAKAFLAKLDNRQRTKAVLPLNPKTRTVWSNLSTR
jgi:hypothetical protein